MRVTSPPESPTPWFTFLDERLRAAVRAAAAGDENPDDALRGLYISDEQALSLAGRLDLRRRRCAAGGRRGQARVSTPSTARCWPSAPRPSSIRRFGRIYAYLQDDVTRRLASPRLAAEPARRRRCRPPADVLACFGPAGAPRARRRDPPACGRRPAPLADRPVKLADRLAAFLLGGGRARWRTPVRRCACGASAAARRPAPRARAASSSMWPGCWRGHAPAARRLRAGRAGRSRGGRRRSAGARRRA